MPKPKPVTAGGELGTLIPQTQVVIPLHPLSPCCGAQSSIYGNITITRAQISLLLCISEKYLFLNVGDL